MQFDYQKRIDKQTEVILKLKKCIQENHIKVFEAMDAMIIMIVAGCKAARLTQIEFESYIDAVKKLFEDEKSESADINPDGSGHAS